MVAKGLRTWFIIHFVTDLVFAIPLIVAPRATLSLFGWETVDPITARVVGAALMAIGLESYLVRDARLEVFRAMINLKIIWSSTAILGIIWGIVEGAPPMAWLFLGLFGIFNAVWVYYRRRVNADL